MNWLEVSERIACTLPRRDRERLGAELVNTLQEADAAQTNSVGLADAVSIAWLVTRRWLALGAENLPLVFAGIPIGAFAFVAILGVVDSHFVPWRAFEDTRSTTASAVAVRGVVDRIVPITLVLCLLAGARAVQHVRRGSFLLPIALVAASLLAASQRQIFLERTEWAFTDNLARSSVDQVSPYSVLLLAAVLMIPLGFLGIDLLVSVRTKPSPLPPFTLRTSGPLLLGLTAASLVVVPFVTPVMLPLVWMSNLSRTTKVLVSLAVGGLALWIGVVFYIDD